MSNLGDRMKSYEAESSYSLTHKEPVICRIDGKAFHTLTRSMEKPYDIRLMKCMMIASIAFAENVSGCQVGYTQSDEASFLITDYQNLTTQAYFDYKLQKLCSVGASVFTSAFLASFINYFPERASDLLNGAGLPAFDARFFNISREEVNNYFIWRQQDCVRNSIQLLARANFSHKQCDRKNGDQLRAMLLEKGIDWEQELHYFRFGTGIAKVKRIESVLIKGETIKMERSRWDRDLEIPLFWENRDYINRLLGN